jgi:hypothetical protein
VVIMNPVSQIERWGFVFVWIPIRYHNIGNSPDTGKLYEINSDISINIGGLLSIFLSQVISFVKFFFIIHADASPFLLLCDNPVEL